MVARAPPARIRSKPVYSLGGDMSYVRKMVNLWADPCNAEMVHPPYAGTTTGYLMRSVDIITPSVSGIVSGLGVQVPLDFVLQWTPSNYSSTTGFVSGGNLTGGGITLAATGGSTFVVDSSSVRAFRPVASCLEFIPTGAIGTRSGAIHFISATSTGFASGTGVTMAQLAAQAQVTRPNAADHYEVKWLPTSLDEELETKAELSHQGCGTVSIMLSSVDGIGTGPSTAKVHGFFRVTTVWEWTPTIVGGIIPDIRKPPGWNTQQILSQVNVERVAHGAARGAVSAGLGFLASSFSNRRAGPSFSRIEL